MMKRKSEELLGNNRERDERESAVLAAGQRVLLHMLVFIELGKH